MVCPDQKPFQPRNIFLTSCVLLSRARMPGILMAPTGAHQRHYELLCWLLLALVPDDTKPLRLSCYAHTIPSRVLILTFTEIKNCPLKNIYKLVGGAVPSTAYPMALREFRTSSHGYWSNFPLQKWLGTGPVIASFSLQTCLPHTGTATPTVLKTAVLFEISLQAQMHLSKSLPAWAK